MAKPFTVVASDRYVRVYREDGSQLSQHLTVEDALEAAVAAGPGRYRIRYPERVVDVSKAYGILANSDSSPPTTPTNLAVTDVTANSVSLSWTASTDDVGVTAYQVWRDGVPAGTTAETTFVDTGLTPGIAYDYMVAANDAAGNQSAQTAEVTAITDSNAAPVWNVGSQALTVGLPYSLTLSSVCSDPDGDTITFTRQSGVLPAGISFANGVVSGTPTTVQSSPVTFRASDPYTYTDRVITFVVSLAADTTAPSVPTALTVTALDPTTLRLTWGASSDPAVSGQSTSGMYRYKIYRDGLYYDYTNTGTLTYTDSDLSTPGLYSYSYQVSAIDVAGNESALTAARTASAPPAGTVTINSIPAVDFVQGLAGQSFDMSGYVDYSGNETLTYAISTGSLPTGVSLSTSGDLSYNGSAAVGSGTVSMSVVEYSPPPAAGDFVFTEIPPELVTVTGIASTEQLGPYMFDVANRWTPGDINRTSGWSTATPVYLRLDSDDSVINTTNNAWIGYDSSTMVLTLKVNSAAADHVVYLEREGTESDRFTLRHLVPTDIWGITGQPAVDNTAFGWNAVEWDAATADWDGANNTGPARATNGSNPARGTTRANPRVIFFCGQTIPYQLMDIGGANDDGVNASGVYTGSHRTFIYLIGDPRSRPVIAKSLATTGVGQIQIRASFAVFYLQNLDLTFIQIFQVDNTSNMRSVMTVNKVKSLYAGSAGTGCDAIGTSGNCYPDDFPSDDLVDVVTGTAGTYAHSHVVNSEIREGGWTDNLKHNFYMEGNGRTATFVNNSIIAGARGCSNFKTIQSKTRLRNTAIASAGDYDTGLASSTTRYNDRTTNVGLPIDHKWAELNLDVKGCSDAAVTNCAIYLARKTIGAFSSGSLSAAYWRARRGALGADIPPYPDLLWSPAVGYDSYFGAGYAPISGFAQDCSTFTNDAYWAAVAATAKTNPLHPYTFKKFFAYNTVTRQMGSEGVTLFRDDGTHPLEATVPSANFSTVLGTHPDWDERSVTFFANNTYVGYDYGDPRYNLDDGLAVEVEEDGTGNAARSYLVTFASGQTGYVRENQANLWIRAWSESIDPQMTALGFNTTGAFAYLSTIQAHTVSGDLSGDISVATRKVGGGNCHVGGTGSQRDINVTITGTWSGTVTLQSSTLNGTYADIPGASWTGNVATQVVNDGLTSGGKYIRAVFKTGQYVSGTATVVLEVPYAHVTSTVLQAFWPPAIPKASRPLPLMTQAGAPGSYGGERFDDDATRLGGTNPYIAIPAGFEL